MLKPLGYSLRRSDTDVGEALQSDVMRFMAILGLCLVAIFALVQSLPLTQVLPKEQSEEQSLTSNPLVMLEPLSAIASETVNEIANETPVDLGDESITNVAENIPRAAISPLSSTEASSVIDEVVSPSQASIATTVELVQDTKEEQNVHEELNPQPAVAREPGVAADLSTSAEASVKLSPVQAHATEAESALLLRFATDKALLALLAQRRVEVYALSVQSVWQLRSERGVLQFQPSPKPQQFHAMSMATVPIEVKAALSEVVPGKQREAVTVAVSLPAEITRQLRRLVEQHKHGELVIHANGQVQHETGL